MSVYNILGYVVWITIAWTTAMTVQLRRFRGSGRSPILKVELASTHQALDEVLGVADREHNARLVRINTYMDFVFILLYSTVFLLLASVVSRSFTPWIRVAILVTAALDVLENLAILSELRRVLEKRGQGSPPYRFSIAKWGAFGLTLVITGLALLEDRHFPYHVVISVLVLASGACSLTGVFVHRIINVSVLLLLPALLVIGVVVFRA